MTTDETALDRVATNLALIAGAISTLAEAVNGTYGGKAIYAQTAAQLPAAPPATPAPVKRGRGRPVVGEAPAATAASTVVAPSQAGVAASAGTAAFVGAAGTSPSEADPFSSAPAAAPAPTATLDDVRGALTALRAATTQENALAVLKAASGVDNLTALAPDKYGAVVAAAKSATTPPASPPVAVDDPFGSEPTPVAAPKAATLEDVKAACVEGAKRTSQDTVLKVIFDHGGKAPLPTGGEGASLKALPEAAFGRVIAAIKALPSTK